MRRAGLPTLVLLVAVAAWYLARAEPPLRTAPERPLGLASVAAPADTAVLVGPTEDTQRTAPPVAGATATPADDTSFARVHIHVTDLDGVPAPGVEVFAAPPRHVLNGFGETDARGELEVRWRSRAWPAELIVELRGAEGRSLTGLRRFDVARGGVARLELVLTHDLLPQPLGAVDLSAARQATEPRQPAPSSRVGVGSPEPHDDGVDSLAGENARPDDRAPGGRGAFEPDVLRDDLGAARFVSGSARGDFGNEFFESTEGDPPLVSDGTVAPAPARTYGAVVDERGLPARGVRIAVEDRSGRVSAAMRTDEYGRFALTFVAGDVRLRAGGVERGSTTQIALASADEFEWNPTVRRFALVRGELPSSVQSARIEASVLVRASGSDTLHVSTLETTGGIPFELTCPPGASFTAHVTQIALPRGAVVDRYDGLVPGVAWSPLLAPLCQVSVVPRDGASAGPEFPAASEVRVFEPEGARGTRFPTWGRRGAQLDFYVTSGTSDLEIGTAGPLWSAPIPLDAPPLGTVELGPVDFGPRGELVLPARQDPAGVCSAAVAREDVPYESVVLPGSRPRMATDSTVALPPGRYVLQHDDGTSAPFVLAPGARFALKWRTMPGTRVLGDRSSDPAR